MKRAILAVRAPSDDDMQRVIESLSSLPGVLSADLVGDEAVVHCSSEIDDEELVNAVYHCEGCGAEIVCDDDDM